MKNKNVAYKEAIQELEDIVYKIENEDPDVDELSSMVKKAFELLNLCKEKLNATEEEINAALEKLKN